MFSNPIYEVTLELTDIDDLFRAPDITPMDARYGAHSATAALDFIADEVYSNGSYRTARATFVVPEADVLDADAVRAAVRRWASARANRFQHEVAAHRWRGTRGLLSGVALFALFITLAQLLADSGSGVTDTLARGLEVFAWVILWYPVDTLVWTVWQHRLDRRSYSVVSDMQITIRSPSEIGPGDRPDERDVIGRS